MTVAVFPGRFQPLHKGTFRAIKRLERSHRPVIAVRSSEAMNTAENPLSFGERRTILRNCLPGIDVFPLADGGTDDELVDRVDASISFSTVVTGDKAVRDAFEAAGFSVESPVMVRENVYSGRRIRETAAVGDERWKDLVPACTVDLLEQYSFPERMDDLSPASPP